LENFLPTIANQQKIMFSLIDKEMAENDGVVNDIRKLITNYTLDAICGIDLQNNLKVNENYIKVMSDP
jgi:hypothetical protein